MPSADALDAVDAAPLADAAPNQYLAFRIGDERFALALGDVREIVRPPDIVPVPLGPPALEGLANLRGSVTAVISLARLLGAAKAEASAAARVVVVERGMPVGLAVDGLEGLLTIPADRIEDAAGAEVPFDGALLAGMVAAGSGRPAVMLLDLDRILRAAFANVSRSTARPPMAGRGAPGAAPTQTGQLLHLLGFEVDGQEYALPVASIEEVIRLPEAMARVPRAQGHVLGVVGWRDRLLPLVCLRRLLGLGTAEPAGRGRVLVLSLAGAGAVGLVADRTRQILRLPVDLADPVPPLLARGGAEEIEAVGRLDGGRRLVSILSPERLFRNDAVRRAITEEPGLEREDRERTMGAGTDDAADTAETFVVFRLGREEYGLPVASVDEIVRLPDDLVHVPRTPGFIEGVMNLRGAVLPVIDQRRRFGLPEGGQAERRRVVVVSLGAVRAGFIVDAVADVLRVPKAAIGPAPELSPEQFRLMSRVATLGERMILLIEPGQLVDRAEAGSLAELTAGDFAPNP